MDSVNREMASLRDEVVSLQAMVVELRTELAVLSAHAAGSNGVDAPAAGVSSRREAFKLAGGVAVGAIAAGGLLARAQPAAATTGSALVIGQLQSAQNITYLANLPAAANSPGTALTTEQTLFWADNRQSVLDHGIGIRGDGNGVNGAGVWGHSDSNGIGLLGDGGLGAQLAGSRAALYLSGTTNAPPATRVDAHKAGEVDIDSNADVWVCVIAGTPGTWRKLTGPAVAGAFHAINPVRVFDSRWPGGAKIASGGTRLVSVADGHDLATGVVNQPNVVPAGASAIAFNLTITDTVGTGFLTIAPGTASTVTASSINWSTTGESLANGLIVAVDGSRQVRAFAGGGGSTNFVLDVAGYFL
jgi:hypothetical protein